MCCSLLGEKTTRNKFCFDCSLSGHVRLMTFQALFVSFVMVSVSSKLK